VALADSEMPDGIREIRDFVAKTWNDGDIEWIWVNAADHEQLSRGAYSVALEGAYEWPFQYQELKHEGKAPSPDGWNIECLNGWCLAVYPDKPPDDEDEDSREEFDDYLWDRPAYMD
jgi:hypothetical protein